MASDIQWNTIDRFAQSVNLSILISLLPATVKLNLHPNVKPLTSPPIYLCIYLFKNVYASIQLSNVYYLFCARH